MSSDFLYGFKSVYVPLPPKVATDTPKTIQPTHLETSLYVAALEVASRRGFPASEVRVFSPLPQFVDGGRWFDGSAWFFTWRHALIEAIQEEARLYPLDLLAWREQPPPEEGVELLAVFAARGHQWDRVLGYVGVDFSMKVSAILPASTAKTIELGEGCKRCKKFRPTLPGGKSPHQWIRDDRSLLSYCRICRLDMNRGTQGTYCEAYCEAYAESPVCYHELIAGNDRESTI